MGHDDDRKEEGKGDDVKFARVCLRVSENKKIEQRDAPITIDRGVLLTVQNKNAPCQQQL